MDKVIDFAMNASVFLYVLGFCALIGALLGHTRGQSVSGFIWSFVLGPIGWVVVFFLPRRVEKKDLL